MFTMADDIENYHLFQSTPISDSGCETSHDEDSRDSGFGDCCASGTITEKMHHLSMSPIRKPTSIDENMSVDSPVARTSFSRPLPRPMRKRNFAHVDSDRGDFMKKQKATFVPRTGEFPAPTRVLARAMSTSVLERGKYACPDDLPETIEVNYHLPTIETPDSQAFRRITAATLAQLLTKTSEEFLHTYVLIDCRYNYEFQGGHIKNAINIFDPQYVSDFFAGKFGNRIPIFYCEYSQKRGPGMAHALRHLDRKRNEQNYPFVDFEEIYVLDGGYKKFFEGFGEMDFCAPHGYIAMEDARFSAELRKYNFHRKGAVATSARPTGRARTFARQMSLDSFNSPGLLRNLALCRPLFSIDDVSDCELTPQRKMTT